MRLDEEELFKDLQDFDSIKSSSFNDMDDLFRDTEELSNDRDYDSLKFLERINGK